jgi:putative hydrolase of the HAD superfamily
MSLIPAAPSPVRLSGQTLLIDADDTLWENNIYFERAITAFISYLDHRIHTPEEVREHLNLCERATISAHGYGLESFRRSLVSCFEQLSDTPVTPDRHARILSFSEAIASNEIELMPAVNETLTQLQKRHRLIMVTKGNEVEQTDKLERSGLRPLFNAVEILTEKDPSAYRDVVLRHRCDPASTWMVGNSPKSDINPALAAGLSAVFIPHDFTWVLEHEPVDRPTQNLQLLELGAFVEMLRYF